MPEEPVIVSGGSVSITFPSSFQEQPSIPEQRYFKNDTARLVRVVVNGQEIALLNEVDVVAIICET
ncbi:MAG: hypothetical protein DMF64_15825 [Acidobacteria bacterium]|nr:MAG: hypothetical protein DMF64_15825 [Acidobacteriota bacterium]